MTEDQIQHMVRRFLGWRLPGDFRPDAGISFKAVFNEHTAHPMKHEPTGTNLFDYSQAKVMVSHMAEGLSLETEVLRAELATLRDQKQELWNALVWSRSIDFNVVHHKNPFMPADETLRWLVEDADASVRLLPPDAIPASACGPPR